MNDLFDLFEVTTFEVNSYKMLRDEFRLNADYFLSSNLNSFRNDLQFKPLSEFAKVIFPGIFKRILVDDPKFGVPFITTSGMMEYSPKPEKYLSSALTFNLDIYKVQEDWILVSRSGTIGNTVFTSEILTPFAITEDALRVIPYDNNYVGFLYFYISSETGKFNIVRKKGGAVIDHIYEEDLMRVEIPLLNNSVIELLQEKYLKVKKLREQANDLLQEANQLIYGYNSLPPLNIEDADFFDEKKMIQSRILNSSSIVNDFRLDAHFYNPISELAIDIIKSVSNFKYLSDLTTDIIIGKRFKRNYVESDFGVPFLSGKNIIQIRPTDLKFLSSSETGFINDLLIKQNWILITCSGTLGRTCFVYKNYEDFAASQHILRVLPNEASIDPGYLFAFLSSEYGYQQIIRFRYGAIIDEIDDVQIASIIVPIPKNEVHSKIIGDKVRLAYTKRSEAIRLEDEAQEILKQSLTS